MWQGKTVSVALPTYNERESIRQCINDFFATGVVDEVVVCNNNAAAGTSEEVAATSAREVTERRQGYGWSCRRAMAEATGESLLHNRYGTAVTVWAPSGAGTDSTISSATTPDASAGCVLLKVAVHVHGPPFRI